VNYIYSEAKYICSLRPVSWFASFDKCYRRPVHCTVHTVEHCY